MPVYIEDYSDNFDDFKWDFPETGTIYKIGDYEYLASNREHAELLANLRDHIDGLCERISRDRHNWNKPNVSKSYRDGVDVFLGLHMPVFYDPNELPNPFFETASKGRKTSRYLLAEIPKGTEFEGISKPRMRFDDISAPPVGKHGTARALYRHIFLNLDLSPKKLEELVIHELAHSMANHVFWEPDNHHADFKWAERLIKKYW